MRVRVQSFTEQEKILSLPENFTMHDLVANLQHENINECQIFISIDNCKRKYDLSLKNPSQFTISEVIRLLNQDVTMSADHHVTVMIAEQRKTFWLGGQFATVDSYKVRLNKLGLTELHLPSYLSKLNLEHPSENNFIDLFQLEKYFREMEDKKEKGLLITNKDEIKIFIDNCNAHVKRMLDSEYRAIDETNGEPKSSVLLDESGKGAGGPVYKLRKRAESVDADNDNINNNNNNDRTLIITSENSRFITLCEAKCDLLARVANFADSQSRLHEYVDLSVIYTVVKKYWLSEYPDELKDADVMMKTHRTEWLNQLFIGKLFLPSSSVFLRKHGFFNVKIKPDHDQLAVIDPPVPH